MMSYSLTHLADRTLLQALADLATQDRTTTATLLAHVAEVDERKLYVPAAYDSMYLYCLHELHMSEDVAYKRIQVARTARQFPALFPLLADGRLNQTAVLLLRPHLSPDTAEELLGAATDKSKAELELLLAERFPQPDVPALMHALAPVGVTGELAAQPVEESALQLAPELVVPSVAPNIALQTEPLPSRAKLSPLSPGRFALQCTVSRAAYEKLRYAQELLGHALPSGDIAELIERALDLLVEKLEKQKFAKCASPRPQGGQAKGRHIPAAVKRAVLERDGGQCTFVKEKGKRCESRTRLEWDHVEPVARGGESTLDNLRLLCRVHNYYEAECVYGSELMDGNRERGRKRAAEAKAHAKPEKEKEKEKAQNSNAAEAAKEQDVIPWLRQLGYDSRRARQGAQACAHIPNASLEERVKVALRVLAPHCTRTPASSTFGPG